jgi:hypothetical protein
MTQTPGSWRVGVPLPRTSRLTGRQRGRRGNVVASTSAVRAARAARAGVGNTCWRVGCQAQEPGGLRVTAVRLRLRVAPFFSPPRTSTACTQRYLQPPFVEPMCVSGHRAPQPRSSSAIVWGAYDMWMFQGSRAWSQWGVVHRFHVLLACRKFWFSNIIEYDAWQRALYDTW